MIRMKLVLKCIQGCLGIASWEVDEEDSTVDLPEYDGSDNQRVELIVTAVLPVDRRREHRKPV